MKQTEEDKMATKLDFSDPMFFSRFKKAAAEHLEKSTRSEITARNALVKSGILTKSGKLSSKYRNNK